MKKNKINVVLSLSGKTIPVVKSDGLLQLFSSFSKLSPLSSGEGILRVSGETNSYGTCGDEFCCQETEDKCSYEKTGEIGMDYVKTADLCAVVAPFQGGAK